MIRHQKYFASDRVDACINLAKWPCAIFALVATIPAMLLFMGVVEQLNSTRPTLGAEIAAGVAAYCLIWWLFLKRTRISFFSTLEHELTHALFALLTLHPVTSIRSAFWEGKGNIGRMTFRGNGNWLITISPYFFPAAPVVTCLIVSVLPNMLTEKTAGTLFGISLAYHFLSTWNETHRGQTDLRNVGFVFATAFLPCANIVAISLCLVWFNNGIGEAIQHLGRLWSLTF